MFSFFNSRSSLHKTPFGAVQTGRPVRFALHVPESMGVQVPVMFLRRDGEEAARRPLSLEVSEAGTQVFSLQLEIGEAGLYFYWFDLWKDYQKLYRGPGGEAVITTGEGEPYALCVYEAAFTTPQPAQGAVMYQIFPDRFLEGDADKPLPFSERVYRQDKHNPPYFWGTETGQGGLTQDYYGGDFAGIEKRLGFLRTLGVGYIYLNPIFEAHSNHRYNTADYMKADPYLGTNEDFARLCQKAREKGIRIILDGVFSHTGSDSLYFNKEGRYPTFGAWQGPESPWRGWYHFLPDGSYKSWWGFATLPECDKQNPDFRAFITGEGGVIDHWLGLGAAGFRLDVADELPDDFIAEIRRAVKRHGEDKLLIGEVWEDAVLKEAYGVRRQYFLGNELDGVMNYPFRTAILNYLKSFDGGAFAEAVMGICEHYPGPALAACTTHLSTHDTMRAITALVGDDPEGHDRNWQSGRRLSPQQYHLGIVRMRLAFALQFTLPGIPCVYYGDEIAMQGYADPFNRGYYEWDSGEDALIPLVMRLSALRRGCAAFKEGGIEFLNTEGGVLHYRRSGGGQVCEVLVNGSGRPVQARLLGREVSVPVMDFALRASSGEY